MKKLLRYIFIPVLAILLMSHNVFAVDMSPNVHPIWTNANPTCAFYNNYGGSGGQWVYNSFSNNSTGQTSTYSISQINCDYPSGLNTKNTYAVYSFRIDNFAYDNSADSGILAIKAKKNVDPADFGVIGVEVSAMGSTGYQFDVYLYGETNNTNGGTFQLYNPLNAEEILYLKPQERITAIGASYWQVTTQNDFEYDYNSILNSISSKLTDMYNRQGAIDEKMRVIRNSVQSIDGKMDDIGKDVADNVNGQQEDATQDASDNSSTEANNNSTDQTTSNLLGVFGSFVTALTSISPSNCNVDFDLGHIDFGVQNLCSQPVPQAFTVVTSIIVVCFTIPFVVHLIRRILSLIREMQT